MREEFMKKTWVVWLGALVCCFLWGSAFPCVKLGYKWMEIDAADTAAQILYAGLRFTLAGILAVVIGSLLQRRILYPTVEALPKVVGLSMLQTVLQYIFFYVGLAHTTGVKSSIIVGTNVFVAILVSGYLFHMEQVTARKILGCVVGFAGVVLVNFSNGMDVSFSFFGEGFIFFSTFAYAFSSVMLKKLSKEYNPVMLSGYQFVIGGIIMVIGGKVAGGRLGNYSGPAIGMLLWLALVSAIAYSLWGVLLKYNPVSKVAVFGFMNPVFGVILSAIFLKEGSMLGTKCLIALVLVSIGILVVNREKEVKNE